MQSATSPLPGLTPGAVRELAVDRLCGALQHSFFTMAGLEATIGPALPQENNRSDGGELVASLIGWVGAWNGTGVLETTPEFACVLTNSLLGTEIDEVDEDALSSVAEMSNIVFGNVKTALEPLLGPMSLQIPTVVHGTGLAMWNPADDFVVLPVRIDGHLLRAKLCMVRNEARRGPQGQLGRLLAAQGLPEPAAGGTAQP